MNPDYTVFKPNYNTLFNQKQLTVIGTHDKPLFIGNEVCKFLGYKNTTDAIIKHVKRKHIFKLENTTFANRECLNFRSDTTLIDESGLYSLIMRSKLPAAEDFQEWVTEDVLPNIRKTGEYKVNQPLI